MLFVADEHPSREVGYDRGSRPTRWFMTQVISPPSFPRLEAVHRARFVPSVSEITSHGSIPLSSPTDTDSRDESSRVASRLGSNMACCESHHDSRFVGVVQFCTPCAPPCSSRRWLACICPPGDEEWTGMRDREGKERRSLRVEARSLARSTV